MNAKGAISRRPADHLSQMCDKGRFNREAADRPNPDRGPRPPGDRRMNLAAARRRNRGLNNM
jgi:hypothetical protein